MEADFDASLSVVAHLADRADHFELREKCGASLHRLGALHEVDLLRGRRAS